MTTDVATAPAPDAATDGIRAPETRLAVVGLWGRFPKASGTDQLWALLAAGADAVVDVPPDRWDTAELLDPSRHVQSVGGFLDDVAGFDASFFRMSPREAAVVDPQQRLFLEAAWRALEDGGIRADALSAVRTGVYVGASWHDYELLRKDRGAPPTPHSAVGNALDVIASRVSYTLGLRGPSLVVETGCSSSLVALHLARTALVTGEVDAAVVGGVNLILVPDVSIGLTHFGGLSARGRCAAFASGADGFVRAECVVGLVVKRLDRALRDGDRVRAVVEATAVNNDGGGESLVTPSVAGQVDLLSRVYGPGGVEVSRVEYVEAHGTGTGRGDPVEAAAVGRVVGTAGGRARPVGIGSVKSNIGHTEAAAGLAGLVKAVLCLEHGVVPPSLHAAELNPGIDFEALNLAVVREATLLTGPDPVIGVNSFGWGGTNAHVALSGPVTARPARPVPAPGTAAAAGALGDWQVLGVSAHSAAALRTRCADLAEALEGTVTLPALADTLARRRDHHQHRVAAVGDDAATVAGLLRRAAAKEPEEEPEEVADEVLVHGQAADPGSVAMVFPGQGGQWAAMGAGLYGTVPAFTAAVDGCAQALAPYLVADTGEVGVDVRRIVAGRAGTSWLERVDLVQPVLWAVSVGLAEVWRAAGVEPGVVVGHSQGEVAAATVAGILTVPDAARVVAVRSRLAARARGNGRMLAVGLGADDVEGVLEGLEDAVCLAVDNSSTASVLSGDADAVLALKEFFDVEGVFCRLVDVDFASHSPHMDALLPELEAALAGIRPRAGTVPFMSTVDVAHLGGESLDAGYWARNLRRPVRFRAAMSALVDGGVTHVVEVSPHPVLATPLGDLPARAGRGPVRVLGTLRRDRGGPGDLAVALAHAYASGLEVRTAAPRPAPVGVPPYPLRRERHWVESRRSVRGAAAAVELSPAPTEPDVWLAEVPVDVDGSPWLTDHRVHGAVVVPGAALVSLALRTLRARFGAVPAELRGVRFERDLTLGTETARVVTEWRDDITEGGTWAVRSLTSDGRAWQRHATARARLRTGADLAAWPVDPPGDGEAWQELDPSAFYAACADRGLEYGPAFRGITALRRRGDETVAEVSLPEPCLAGADALDPHPSLLDAVLQTCLAGQVGVGAVVPQAVDRVVWHGGGGGLRRVRATCRGDLERGYDLDVHDVDGGLLVIAVRGLRLAVLADSAPEEGEDRFHHLAFVADERTDERTAAGQPVAEPAAVLVCGDPGAAAALAAATGGTPVAGGGAVAALASVGQAGGTGHLVFAAPGRDAGVARQRAALGELAQLVRGLVGGGLAARVCVVTTRGQAVGGEDVDPGGGLFWGFARVLRREHPELAARIIDTDRGPAWAEQVAAELTREDDQVVHRDGTRHAGRITAGRPDPAPGLPPVRTRADQPFRLVSRSPGRWDGVDFEPVPLPEPGPSQVRVEVSAASLNFIDVMKAMGTYPDPVGGSLLGGECAGRVVAVGSDVTRLRVGDRVVACEFGSVASHVTVASDRVRVIPDHLDDAEAAVLPLVLVTAWYGLVDRAGLRAGETVLVHSAAGGLGLAALAVARAVGATVIATAGTEHKRQVLRGMGVTHVFDSGDTGWAEEVRAATGGRGVDVVLNSLTGVAIDLGLDVLAEDGRFVEVGKKDVYGGRHLAMSAFAKGLAFSAVDIAGLMDRRPERFAAVLDEVWQRVADGSFAPLPVTRHPFAAAAEVLREMATGRHVGKLVLVDPATVTSCRAGAPAGGGLRPDATYVVTGGLGALGLSLAEHLVGEGAGALALLGRREPGPRAAARIEAMRGSGADVRCLAVDVADADALARALDRVRSGMPPIRGVVHAAGVLADETIVSATPGAFDAVLAPKVAGAANLDRLTAGDPLDLFVLFSSAAALVGNPGQAAYAAANAYLDALAQARRAAGRPALSVQWGPFDDVGLAAEDDNRGRRLADRGMGGFGTAQAWPALRSLLAEEAVVAAYVPLDVRQWFEAYPDTVSVPSWSWLRDRDPAAGGGRPRGRFLERFRAVAEEQRLGLVEHEVRVLAGRVLRMAPDAIDATAPLKSLGLDSLMSLEYRNRLEAALGLTFPPTLLWTFGTTEALSRALTDRLRAAAEVPAPA